MAELEVDKSYYREEESEKCNLLEINELKESVEEKCQDKWGNRVSAKDDESQVPHTKVTVDPDKGSRIRLEWSSINVSATLPPASCMEKMRRCCRRRNENDQGAQKTIPILTNISGVAEPGSILAIMGASGSGKTTILNVLSRQNLSGLLVDGDVSINLKSADNKIKNISGYVQQEDVFVGTLTVKEHLIFQALLRMGSKYSRKEKVQRVDDVMSQLGLLKCQDTIIGIPGRIRGISGGEKKRLSFASEIITNPTLLFVDEPTSGLDSFMAESAIVALQKLASEGRTILATIHQPSSEVFQFFDRLLLLSSGQTAFLGTTDEAATFFSSVGHPSPSNFNPADHYIRTLALIPGKEEECKAKAASICDSYNHGKYAYKKESPSRRKDPAVEVCTRPTYKENAVNQYRALVWRSAKAFQREPYVSNSRMIQAIVVALIGGLVFLRQENNQDGARNINGAFFFIIINISFANALSVVFVFPAELPVFLKEHKAGMYRLDIYFMARTLAELPWYILSTAIYATITYFMIGLRMGTAPYFVFLGILQLTVQCVLSYGLLISSLAPTVQVAISIAAPLLLPFVLFGGFFLKDDSIPVYFVWLKMLSWIKYSYEAVAVNQWRGFGPIECTNNSSSCIPTGDAVLQVLGYDQVDLTQNVGVLIGLTIGFRFISFLLVVLRSYRTK